MKSQYDDLFNDYKHLIEQINLSHSKLESLIEGELSKTTTDKEILSSLIKQTESLTTCKYAPTDIVTKDVSLGILYTQKSDTLQMELTELIKSREDFYNIPTVLFTIDDIVPERNFIDGLYIFNNKMSREVTTLPNVIYNTALLSKPSSTRTMRQLRTDNTIQVINPLNWFHQDILFDMLSSINLEDEILLPYRHLNNNTLHDCLETWDSIYIIPRRHYSHPRIISIYPHNKNEVKVSYGVHNQIVEREDLFFTIYKMIRSEGHLLIKGVPLATKQIKSPQEYRFYVQKGIDGRWEHTSQLIKKELFSVGSIRDGEVLEVENRQLLKNLGQTSINMATYFDFLLPNLGCLYFDYLITDDGNPYLIYIGGIEQFDYIARLNKSSWRKYLNKILDYLQFSVQKQSARLDAHD